MVSAACLCCMLRTAQALYCRNTDIDKVSECDPAAYGAMCEAKLVDETFKQGLPFIGVFCDGELGPPVHCGCLGLGAPGVSSLPHAFTSMLAAFGCRTG